MAKVIAITGAGEGLGRALARRFAQDGDTVILLGRTPAKVQALAETLGERHSGIGCDVTDPQSVRTAFKAIAERHKHIDVLINNAALFEPFLIETVSDEDIRATVDTNLLGPIFCTREAVKLMGRGGHIINVSSDSVQTRFPLLWLYEATKVALERFSDSVGRDVQPLGIRSTVIRAGAMTEKERGYPNWPPEVAMKFMKDCEDAGLDLQKRSASDYNSPTDIFRAVIDTPADLHIPLVGLVAWAQ